MRGKTLLKLLDEVRAEARLSQNPAHNNQTRDAHVILLQREQERLWEDYAWPHLRVERLLPVANGQRYYDPPDDLSADRVERIQFKSDGDWLPLWHGINAGNYAVNDSDLDSRSWPTSAWRVVEDQIEVWPIPDQSGTTSDQTGYMKLIGIRNLRPLIDDSDRADLDDRMLVLYVAGGLLAAAGAKDAQLKIEAANKIYSRLKADQMKGSRFRMFGAGETCIPRQPAITRYRPPA